MVAMFEDNWPKTDFIYFLYFIYHFSYHLITTKYDSVTKNIPQKSQWPFMLEQKQRHLWNCWSWSCKLTFISKHLLFFIRPETWKNCYFLVYLRYWQAQANQKKIKPKFQNGLHQAVRNVSKNRNSFFS